MLQLFRRNLFIYSLLLLPYIFLVRFKSLFGKVVPASDNNSLFLSNLGELELAPMTIGIFSCLLIFIQAVMINRLAIKNAYDRNFSLFPGLFYIIFMSILPEYLLTTPALIANTFTLLVLSELNKLYKKHMAAGVIFNIGFFGIIAVLIYYPNLILLPVYVIGIFSLRAQSLKEFLQFASGIVVAFFLSFSYYYLIGQSGAFWGFFSDKFFHFEFRNKNFTTLIIFLLWVFALVGMKRGIVVKKAIQVVKKINLYYWILLWGIFLPLIGTNLDWVYKLIPLTIPCGILTGLIFANSKNKFIPELVHLVFLAIILNNQFDLLALIK